MRRAEVFHGAGGLTSRLGASALVLVTVVVVATLAACAVGGSSPSDQAAEAARAYLDGRARGDAHAMAEASVVSGGGLFVGRLLLDEDALHAMLKNSANRRAGGYRLSTTPEGSAGAYLVSASFDAGSPRTEAYHVARWPSRDRFLHPGWAVQISGSDLSVSIPPGWQSEGFAVDGLPKRVL